MTEKEVNKAALGMLRSYYRLRIKSDSPEVTSDVRGAGGIIADGAYAFRTPDGERFLATVESTSADTKDEVYYKLQRWLLAWDSATVASIITLLWFSWTFINDNILVKKYGVNYTTLLIAAVFLGAYLFYFLIFRRLRRYRYIYAVEQFKRYHADEQWIAIAEDVFAHNNDKYYLELRNQCIYNGFGLIVVDQHQKPYLAITPARRELFSGSRKIVQFFSQNQINRLLQRSAGLQEWWKKFSKGMPLQIVLSDPDYFLRFRRPVINQIVVCGISWVMIGFIFYVEWQQRPVRYVSQEKYEEEVITRQVQSQGEPNRTIILPNDSIYIRPFDNKVIPYLLLLQSEQLSPITAALNKSGTDVLIGMLNGTMIVYDCERLYNFQTPKFILQEGVYPDFETVTRRMNQLLAEGLQVNSIWMGCFSEKDQSYILYFDELLDSKAQAEKLARDYHNKLKNKNLDTPISIKTLMPKR